MDLIYILFEGGTCCCRWSTEDHWFQGKGMVSLLAEFIFSFQIWRWRGDRLNMTSSGLRRNYRRTLGWQGCDNGRKWIMPWRPMTSSSPQMWTRCSMSCKSDHKDSCVLKVLSREALHKLRWCETTHPVLSGALWMPLGRFSTVHLFNCLVSPYRDLSPDWPTLHI